MYSIYFFFFNDTATTEIYTLSLHDALPIFALNLLFGVPLPIGGLITAVVAFVLLAAQSRGDRPVGRVISGLLLVIRSEEHTSELQSPQYLVFRLLLVKKKNIHLVDYFLLAY